MTTKTAKRVTPTGSNERRFQRLMRQEKRRHGEAEAWGWATLRIEFQRWNNADPDDLEWLFRCDGLDYEENGIMAHVDRIEERLEAGNCLRQEIEFVFGRCASYIVREVQAGREVSLPMARVYQLLQMAVASWRRKVGTVALPAKVAS